MPPSTNDLRRRGGSGALPRASTSLSPSPLSGSAESRSSRPPRPPAFPTRVRGPGNATLKQDRLTSRHNLRLAFESIFRRYSRGEHVFAGRDDIWDVTTNKIIERDSRAKDEGVDDDSPEDERWEIGDFGLPGAMGQDDEDVDEDENDNENEKENEEDDGSDANRNDDAKLPRQPEGGRQRFVGLSPPASQHRRGRSKSLATFRQPAEATSDSSEDDMGTWTVEDPVAETYLQDRQRKREFRDDLAGFLKLDAKLHQIPAPSPPATPISGRSMVLGQYGTEAPYSRANPRGPLSVPLSASGVRHRRFRRSSRTFEQERSSEDVKPPSSILASRPLIMVSDPTAETFTFQGMNLVHMERVAVNSDSESDDELSISRSTSRSARTIKREVKEENIPVERMLSSNSVTAGKAIALPRMTPVVEVLRRAAFLSSQGNEFGTIAISSEPFPSKRRVSYTRPSTALAARNRARSTSESDIEANSSPTKRSRLTTSRSAALGLHIENSDSEDLPLARRVVEQACPHTMPKASLARAQIARNYRPNSPPSSRESKEAFYSVGRPPSASTSYSLGSACKPMHATASSDQLHCAIPTPPLSFASTASTSSESKPKLTHDTFKVPSPPRQSTRSPAKADTWSRTLSMAVPTASASKHIFAEWTQSPYTQERQRLGSIIRDTAAKAPDDDRDELGNF